MILCAARALIPRILLRRSPQRSRVDWVSCDAQAQIRGPYPRISPRRRWRADRATTHANRAPTSRRLLAKVCRVSTEPHRRRTETSKCAQRIRCRSRKAFRFRRIEGRQHLWQRSPAATAVESPTMTSRRCKRPSASSPASRPPSLTLSASDFRRRERNPPPFPPRRCVSFAADVAAAP